MADVFDYVMVQLLTKKVKEQTSKFSGKCRKKRFLTVPKQIIENIVKSLGSYRQFLVVNLDMDPLTMVNNEIDSTKFNRFVSYVDENPGIKFTFLRKFINLYTFMLDDKEISKIIFITSDPIMVENLGFVKKNRYYAKPNPMFSTKLDDFQMGELNKYNNSVTKYAKIIEFDDVKMLTTKFISKIS